MVKASVIEKLKVPMNINSYEAKVWAALLSRGISSAGELADISGVPRSRCYDVLESLEKKGFVFKKIGKPIRYIGIAPEEVLETLKKTTRLEENQVIALFDELKQTETFTELKELYDSGINHIDTTEISSSILGKQNINTFLKGMLDRASKEVIIHTDSHNFDRKIRILKKSGKNLKATVFAPVKESTNHKNLSLINKDTGLRLVNVDDEVLFFTSEKDTLPEAESAVWVRSKFVVDSLKEFLK